jgi:mannose-1-phosphate guanylyltransferase
MTPSNPERGALILAGGRGERFWPWSTPDRPKQLLPLASGGRTLLAATFERATRLVPAGKVVVMTSLPLVEACRRECPGAIVVGEPVGRNTAPAIAAAAAFFDDRDVFAVLPSDHAIDDEAAFTADLDRAFDVAAREALLVTFGIVPTHAETGFGYVQRGARLAERLHRVARFTEKPDAARAAEYLASGQYAWNSGMFVWSRRTFLDALAVGRPAIAEALSGLRFAAGQERAFEAAIAERFAALESQRGDARRLVRLGRPRQLERLGATPAARCARERLLGRGGSRRLRRLRGGRRRDPGRAARSAGHGGGGHAAGHVGLPTRGQ